MPNSETVPMSILVPASVLDDILAVQLTMAWAGEGRCDPARLGWWQTDLIDEAGGVVDLFVRLGFEEDATELGEDEG
jgi:hypothetical protein